MVARIAVEAEQMFGLRRRTAQQMDARARAAHGVRLGVEQGLDRIERRDLAGKDRDQDQEPQQDQADPSVALAQDVAQLLRVERILPDLDRHASHRGLAVEERELGPVGELLGRHALGQELAQRGLVDEEREPVDGEFVVAVAEVGVVVRQGVHVAE